MSSLSGKTVLVTRSAGQSSHFTHLLQQHGAIVIEMPTLEITPPSSWVGLDAAIAQLTEFDWLILTSANAVNYFFERLATHLQEVGALAGIKIAVVGEKTAFFLRKRGMEPDFIPPDFIADAMVINFPEPIAGKKLLFPRVESGGREVLIKEFTDQGAIVTEVAAYQSSCPTVIDAQALTALQHKKVDVVTFASSKTVRHFCQLIGEAIGPDWPIHLQTTGVASIGPQTSKTCATLLGKVDIEAAEYTLEGLTQAVVDWVAKDQENDKLNV
jgi:uroporphyrinogen-III synthase